MKISVAVSNVKALCIETAPFIHFVERHPVYLDRMRAIVKIIDTGRIKAFSSTVTLTEVLTQPLRVGNTDLVKEYRDILINSRNFTLIPIDINVSERAADLRARYNLKTPDALQIAVAVKSGCDVFLTNDLSLKRVTELRILVLDELEVDTP